MTEDVDTARASKAGYARSDWEFGEDSFSTREHGAEEVMSERERKIYAHAFDFEVVCAARARAIVHRKLERDIKNKVQGADFGSRAVPVSWANPTTAEPIKDILTEVDTFKTGSGVLPNVGVTTDTVMRKLKLCAEIRDQLKFSGIDDPKFPMAAFARALAQLLDLEEIIVASAVRNTANKNKTPVLANIWADEFGLYRLARTNDLTEMCAVRTLVWTGDGAGIAGAFETYWDETKRATIMRYRQERQVKVIQSSCGRRLTGVAA
jgi:hypothetical protein